MYLIQQGTEDAPVNQTDGLAISRVANKPKRDLIPSWKLGYQRQVRCAFQLEWTPQHRHSFVRPVNRQFVS